MSRSQHVVSVESSTLFHHGVICDLFLSHDGPLMS